MNLERYLFRCQKLVQNHLDKYLIPPEKSPSMLHEAMRYAVLNGGKRIRAALVYATGEALGAKLSVLHKIATSMEMVHAFSLVHDDLPALDNDDLRRGQPTCHKVYGEALAILAGDALQAKAFELLCTLAPKPLSEKIVLRMLHYLASAIGSQGLIGGETLDILMDKKTATLEKLTQTYQWKTGSLLTAAILLGALAAQNDNQKMLLNLQKFGQNLGLLFQIHDDIIGMESSTEILGKTQGKDDLLNKSTFPGLLGLSEAKQREEALHEQALKYLKKAGLEGSYLSALTDFIMHRNH